MLEVTPLSPVLAKIAQTELNEDEKTLPQSIEVLREWAKDQPHLICPMQDKFFLFVLRAAKHDIEKAKIKIDAFLTMRTMAPDFFANRDIHNEKVVNYLRMGAVLHLPNTEGPDSPRIMIMRCSGVDATKYLLTELINAGTLLSDLRYEIDDIYRVIGVKVVVDLSGFTMAHMTQFRIALFKTFFAYYHKVMTIRVKGFYVINATPLAVTLINIIKTFLPKKLKSRFFVCSSMKDFAENFPIEYLPNEYGGNAGKFDDLMENEIELIKKHWHDIKKWYDYGVDESKRLQKPKTSEKSGSVERDFKNLECD